MVLGLGREPAGWVLVGQVVRGEIQEGRVRIAGNGAMRVGAVVMVLGVVLEVMVLGIRGVTVIGELLRTGEEWIS